MKRIVVATDGSPGSRLASTRAIELARSTGAGITFVTVMHGPGFSSDPVSGQPAASAAGDELAAVQEAVAEAEQVGVEADFQFVQGDAAKAIVDYAREHDADLIVVGSRDLGSVKSLVLGSVSRDVVDHADRPVLVVK